MKRPWRSNPPARARWIVALAGVFLLAGDTAIEHPMIPAAQKLIDRLDQSQRGKLILPFSSDERTDWSYLPGRRPGIPLGEMNEEQRSAAFDLLRTVLSDQGYIKAVGVITLEAVLRELEGDFRDPGRYWFTLFGSPGLSSPWGWRLEGHHLSLNFSSVTGELIATTPAFFGAHPANIPHGPNKGKRVLAMEEDSARALVASFDREQKRKAVISAHAPRDIITGRDRKARLSRFEGISFKELDATQQDRLLALLRVYIGAMKQDVAEVQWSKIRQAGFEKIHFAWAGRIVPGQPHYYRIHGPTFVAEYDNTQNNANHVHSVWRDFENDFGDDLLRKHYEQKKHE